MPEVDQKTARSKNGPPSDLLSGGEAVRVSGSLPHHLLSVARAQWSFVLESEVLRRGLRISGSGVGENR